MYSSSFWKLFIYWCYFIDEPDLGAKVVINRCYSVDSIMLKSIWESRGLDIMSAPLMLALIVQ